jgi:hypothetical protein
LDYLGNAITSLLGGAQVPWISIFSVPWRIHLEFCEYMRRSTPINRLASNQKSRKFTTLGKE